jgi:hypothetical protein
MWGTSSVGVAGVTINGHGRRTIDLCTDSMDEIADILFCSLPQHESVNRVDHIVDNSKWLSTITSSPTSIARRSIFSPLVDL